MAASPIAAPRLKLLRKLLGVASGRADDLADAMSNPSSDPENMDNDRTDEREPRPSLDTGLYIVSTPIGNLRDITLRALDVLASVNRLYAEDTRVARKLLDAHSVRAKVFSYHEHNAETARDEILAALDRGESVALISDAGTPLISDPGFKLVRAAAAAGHFVSPIPGASASLAALVVSGLPSDRFLFAGFLSARHGARRTALSELAQVDATLILYETGPRLAASLADMAEVLGPRQAAVARELTKLFEETRRGTLAELAQHYQAAGAPKGEIVLVVSPPDAAPEITDEALDAFLENAIGGGVREAAIKAVEVLGVPRKRAYARALALKGER